MVVAGTSLNVSSFAMKDLTAFVLAGGRNSRMGSDKAFVRIGGKPMLERALDAVSGVAESIKIVGDPAKFQKYAATVSDIFAGQGPMGGIHAALRDTTTEYNLILAVDIPFVSPEFLRFLAGEAKESSALVTVPRVDGQLQPLCAVYRRAFAELAEHALRSGQNKIADLFDSMNARVLDQELLGRTEFSIDMFENVNTAEELERARKHEEL